MTPFLLVAALAAGQATAKEVNLAVRPAEPPRFVLQWQLLPPLLDQEPGECLALIAEAEKARKEALPTPDAERQVTEELDEALTAALPDVDRKRLQANLERMGKTLARVEKAARAERCDWTKLYAEMRAKGIAARLDFVQEFRGLVKLLAARARYEVLDDRPRDAVRSLALGLRLARHVGEGPTLINHLVGTALAAILVEQLDVVLAHPKSPNLYWSLTSLPSPFLSLRPAMEGERTWAFGTFPDLSPVALDPDAAPPSEAALREFGRTVKDTLNVFGVDVSEVDRLRLGLAIQLKHPQAMRDLAARGFPADKLQAWPPLLVALVRGLIDYEERLGRMAMAMAMPYPQAMPALAAVDKELADRGPAGEAMAPAIDLARLLLPSSAKVTMANARTERRLAALRTVEALRLHAARTGDWPKTLAEVTAVPVPDDPVTGRPFAYKAEGGVAVVHGVLPPGEPANHELYYRLKLK